MSKEKIVSAKEVAKFLNVTEGTVYRLAKDGTIPGVRIGNQWRFDLDQIRSLFHQNARGSDLSTVKNSQSEENKEQDQKIKESDQKV